MSSLTVPFLNVFLWLYRSAQPGAADANGVGLGRGGPMSAGLGGQGMQGMMGGGRGRGKGMKGVKAFKGRGGA